ncbi:30S ribosomal protein S16 [Cellulophaga sp. Hel_I_12]|uniref:30S ribosomal protein S16 n=1 Tax=Cellulophaga sp. Hel_I_12 TaxID=1249972 RepID=UPI000645944F|nr:30S ribosomal protein S16 [Cellulophaga sp. Hel_I_12]
MPVKIRLQRHGKKGKPFYWVVAADARAKRDGKYLEKLGIYNPNTNPATIEVNVDQAVTWLNNGAQPTETAKRILSYKGVLLKHHLAGGVRKGALTEEQAEEKFNAWLEEKGKIVGSKVGDLDKAKADSRAAALKAEKEVNEKRIAAAIPEEVVETPEAPQPETENADTTPIPTVVEKDVLEETDGIAEAPSVKEVIADQKEEDTDKKA